MKVIFLQDVKKQAKKDEIKEVKDGYAKFLINQKLAVPYTEKSLNVLNNEIKERNDKEEALIKECNNIKNAIKDKTITFKVKTGNNDKVFGNITSKQISEEISKLGYNIDKKKINTFGDINTLGVHEVEITLHKKVVFKMNINLTK
jgi:large subunit ribosomal protein L9